MLTSSDRSLIALGIYTVVIAQVSSKLYNLGKLKHRIKCKINTIWKKI